MCRTGAAGLGRDEAKRTAMPGETRIERRLDRAVDRATTPRGAAVVIAVVSVAMTLLAGILMTSLTTRTIRPSAWGCGGPSRP